MIHPRPRSRHDDRRYRELAQWMRDIERVLSQIVEGDTSGMDPDAERAIRQLRQVEVAYESLQKLIRFNLSETLAEIRRARHSLPTRQALAEKRLARRQP